MANTTFNKGLLALLASAALATPAMAGGFSRGEADTDILYEDATAAFRTGAVFVSPHRDFDTIRGVAATDDRYSDNYWIPSVAAKVRFSDLFSCAATFTEPFGADSTYGAQARIADISTDLIAGRTPNAVNEAGFDSNEYAATCAAKFGAGRGNAYILGGLFVQDFDYTEVKTLGTLNLKDQGEVGYRLGAAYEITEYALRGEVMYRSQIDQVVSGNFTAGINIPLPPALGGGVIPVGTVLPATGAGSLPQSLEVSLQSGIAPDWLAYGSVKWTDWSVLQTLNYTIRGLGPNQKEFFWRDGWTVQAGIGHKFSDDVSGTVNLTWDRGVGQGADIMSDTWTVGAGAQIQAGVGALRLGGAVSYLTAGDQFASQGAAFDATADGDWAYALTGSYVIKF